MNGAYCTAESANISIFDRGLLFAHSVYEVVWLLNGKLLDFDEHIDRLERSLDQMRIPSTLKGKDIRETMFELAQRDGVVEGYVYLQITAGAEDGRGFLPTTATAPNVMMFVQPKGSIDHHRCKTGIKLASVPDIRWARRDIKSTALMGQVIAKWQANEMGADEALLHEDGIVTEGASTKFFFVKDGCIVTRPNSNAILNGCTRKSLWQAAENAGLQMDQRLFSVDEAKSADEAFISGSGAPIWPVTKIDEVKIGSGILGPITSKVQELYLQFAINNAV